MIDRPKRYDLIDGWGNPVFMTQDYTPTQRRQVTPLTTSESFVRSNGTILARLYERLTKASRRKGLKHYGRAYRQGVYDAFKALQDELPQ